MNKLFPEESITILIEKPKIVLCNTLPPDSAGGQPRIIYRANLLFKFLSYIFAQSKLSCLQM